MKGAVRGRHLIVAREDTASCQGRQQKSVACGLRNLKRTKVKCQTVLEESPMIKVPNKDSESSINIKLFPL